MSSDHKLAAILFADIAGYTAMMQKNEQDALKLLNRFKQALEDITPKYQGQIVQYFGDGCLLSFDSSISSVDCAIALQRAFSETPALPVRIGLHLGDVIFTDQNVYGDGVNIASRIESLGVPGAVLMSKSIRDHIKNQEEYDLVEVGSFDLKNVEEPIRVYALANPGFVVPKREQMKGKLKQDKKKLNPVIWITAISLLAVSIFLITNFLDKKEEKSIAVLAFRDRSPAQDQEFLGDGVAISVHSLLSHVKDLKVIGWKSSFFYKGKNVDLPTIGKLLKVRFLVDGWIQEIGESKRIHAFLIDAATGAQIWSEPFDVNPADTFNVHDKIAESIADKINARMSAREMKILVAGTHTSSPNYEDYAKGQYYLYKLTRIGVDSAFHFFDKVLQKDSNYAPAYAGIADVWCIRMQQGLVNFPEAKTKMDDAAQKAKALAPSLSQVRYTLGLAGWLNWDWPSLSTEFNESINLAPSNSLAHLYLSNFQYILGQPDNARFHNKKALELDAENPLFTAIYSMNLMYEGKTQEAIQVLEDDLKKSPDHLLTITNLRTAYHLVGRYEDAINMWRKSLSADKASDSVLNKAYKESGYHKALQQLAEHYANKKKRSWTIATLYTRAGMKEKAFEWLYKAYEAHDANMPYLKVDPIFEFMRKDPRYADLLKKMNLAGGKN